MKTKTNNNNKVTYSVITYKNATQLKAKDRDNRLTYPSKEDALDTVQMLKDNSGYHNLYYAAVVRSSDNKFKKTFIIDKSKKISKKKVVVSATEKKALELSKRFDGSRRIGREQLINVIQEVYLPKKKQVIADAMYFVNPFELYKMIADSEFENQVANFIYNYLDKNLDPMLDRNNKKLMKCLYMF